jgi:hypothetical protein
MYHAFVWVSRTEHGKELTSNVRIVEFFGFLEMAGRPAAIPKATWDAGGQDGIVKIGGVYRQSSSPVPYIAIIIMSTGA